MASETPRLQFPVSRCLRTPVTWSGRQSVLSSFTSVEVIGPESVMKYLVCAYLMLSAHCILGGEWDKNPVGNR